MTTMRQAAHDRPAKETHQSTRPYFNVAAAIDAESFPVTK